MAARPRIALVGAGSMGSLHARVVSQSDRADLVAVVEPRAEVGRALAERFGTAWVADLDDAGHLDAVIVAAATEAHHGLAMRVVAAGLPLLVEKPVADSLAASTEVVEASAAAGVPLMCGLLERYNGAVMTAMALTREPVHVTGVRHSPYAPRIKTGVAWDLLVHDVDLAVQLLGGDPVDVQASIGLFHPSSLPGAEDVVETVMRYENGAVATVSASRIGQRKVRSLTIAEVDRLIEVDLLRRDVTLYRHVSNATTTEDGLGYRQQTIIEIPELVSNREPLAVQLDRFVDLIAGEVDADEERRSILPAHRVVERAVAARRAAVQPA